MSETITKPTRPILWPRPNRTTKRQQYLAALASCMKLLVVIRESLKANPGGSESPLYAAVNEHAQMCGKLLPNSMRIPLDELDKIKTNSALPVGEEEPSRIIKP